MPRVQAVAFDVIETLFPIAPLRPRLVGAGLPEHALETWFAQILRDAFALEVAGSYEPFATVATSALRVMLRQADLPSEDSVIESVLEGFQSLDPHDDVTAGFDRVKQAGLPLVTLTNGSAKVTEALLDRAGLRDRVDQVIVIDDVKHWKPSAAVYTHCAAQLDIAPARLALVAAHGWDIHGAARAGLATGFVRRDGQPMTGAMHSPDVQADDLPTVIDRLAALPDAAD